MGNVEWIYTFVSIAVIMTFVGIILVQRTFRGKRYGLALMEDGTIYQELLTFACTLTVLGIIFGSDRFIGYSFIGSGILLSIIVMIKTKKEGSKILDRN